RIASLLYKQGVGIKDVWITPEVEKEEVAQYFSEAFDENITIRSVDMNYLHLITNHFLSLTLSKGHIPAFHLLEFQEMLGIQFCPKEVNVSETIQQIGIEISPFTEAAIEQSFARSYKWSKNKRFTESWYQENARIDK